MSRSPKREAILAAITLLVGFAWLVLMGWVGVGADGRHVPVPWKLVLTVGALLIPCLLVRWGRWGGLVFACLLGILYFIFLFTMWFWN